MARNIILAVLLSLAPGLWAVTITDDFDRSDTTQSTNGANIGTGWVASAGATEWSITSSRVVADSSTLENGALLYNAGLETVSGSNSAFSCSLDVRSNTGGRWVGVAFNIQNDTNYYAVRIKANDTAYQCLRIVDGTVVAIVNKADASATFEVGSFYTIEISSDTAHQFDFTITAAGSGTVLNPTTGFSDGQENFTGGYAGLYSGSTSAALQWDNFALEVLTPQENVADDFSRTNTVSGLDGEWVSDSLYYINNNEAETKYDSNTGVSDIAWNTAVRTVSGSGTNFLLSADVNCSSGGRMAGVVFNVQNETNYYALLLVTGQATYRVGQVSDGTLSWLVNKTDATETFAPGTAYTLTVMSDTVGTYSFMITETGSSTVLNPTTGFTDGTTPFTGGYAGLFSVGNSGTYRYDNFELALFYDVLETTPPEIGTISIDADNSDVVVSWTNGSDAVTYILQGRTNLNNGVWSNLVAGIPGENGEMSVTSSMAGTVGFYRIVGE